MRFYFSCSNFCVTFYKVKIAGCFYLNFNIGKSNLLKCDAYLILAIRGLILKIAAHLISVINFFFIAKDIHKFTGCFLL